VEPRRAARGGAGGSVHQGIDRGLRQGEEEVSQDDPAFLGASPLQQAADSLDDIARRFGETADSWQAAVDSARNQQAYDQAHGAGSHPEIDDILRVARQMADTASKLGAQPAFAAGPAMTSQVPAGWGQPAQPAQLSPGPDVWQPADSRRVEGWQSEQEEAARLAGRDRERLRQMHGGGYNDNRTGTGGTPEEEKGPTLIEEAGQAFSDYVVGAGRQVSAAFSQVASLSRSFGVDKASPNTQATLEGSMDLFMARIGASFSETFEKIAKMIQDLSENSLVKAGAKFLGNSSYVVAEGWSRIGSAFSNLFAGKGLYASEDDAPPKRSMKGLPGPAIGSAESYYDTLAMKGLATGTNILKEQLKELQRIGLSVSGLNGNASLNAPAWRP
jgi:hypothetical protein